MVKKTLLLLALTVSALGLAEASFAIQSNSSASSHGGTVTEAVAVVGTSETGNWDGYISGQFLYDLKRKLVKGAGSSVSPASSAAWNGYIKGQLELPRITHRESIPVRISEAKNVWNGYLEGSFKY